MSYMEALAYIHDQGFGDFARNASHAILEILKTRGIMDGHVLDLGCGSGISSKIFADSEFRVTGIDYSSAMIDIARKRAPQADFIVASIYQVKFPVCNVVLAMGECFNYLFDPKAEGNLPVMFKRIYQALQPGGVFIFDVAEPGQVDQRGDGKSFLEGIDWAILTRKQEDKEQQTLIREMSLYRQIGKTFRKSSETHQVRLYRSSEIAKLLRAQGFRVQIRRKYGQYPLRKNVAAFFARRS